MTVYRIVKTLTVKTLANCSQFAKVFSANVHDEACDHTICVAERTRKLNNCVATRYMYLMK